MSLKTRNLICWIIAIYITSTTAQLTLRLTHSCDVARTTARNLRLSQSHCQKNETGHHYTTTCEAFNIRLAMPSRSTSLALEIKRV